MVEDHEVQQQPTGGALASRREALKRAAKAAAYVAPAVTILVSGQAAKAQGFPIGGTAS